jgi:hypothetical protein
MKFAQNASCPRSARAAITVDGLRAGGKGHPPTSAPAAEAGAGHGAFH